MAGFSAIISKKNNIPHSFSFREKNIYGHEVHYDTNTIVSDFYLIEQFTHQKFLNDKVFQQDDEYIIGVEGVILNLQNLKVKTGLTNTFDIIKTLFLEKGSRFVKHLKGDFSGFIFSKTENKWLVFTNPIGSKRIFYFDNDEYLLFASDLRDISHMLHKLSLKVSLNVSASYLLLTYGYMLEESTLIQDAKRLTPGTILTCQDNEVSISEYFHLRNITTTSDSKDQIIEKMDELFCNAIRLEFEKDKEYNYKHIATLSGGLDSRMTVLTAHKLGYEEQLNFTFSQSNYLDEKLSKKIAIDYHHDFLFQSLDYGNYLKNIDKTIYYNDGLILYSGSAHVLKSIENMNLDAYGLVHTGLVGDAVIGSFLSKPFVVKPTITSGAYSTKLINKIAPLLEDIVKKYPSEELYKFYGRGFLGALNGNYYFDIFSQTVSPFLDIDFLSYCYSIPEEYKYKQAIYFEWIARKHPEFAKYRWEKTGVSPLKSNNFKKFFDFYYYQRMSLKFFDKISGKMNSGMNPFDYWLSQNKGLKDVFENYFSQQIHFLENYPELKSDCEYLFTKGNSNEKTQVLTLLGAIKLHFSFE